MDMEVDSFDSNPLVVVESAPSSPSKPSKDRLLDLLDKIELHVEKLRQDAFRLEEEKDKVLTTLVTLKNSEILQSLGHEDQEDVHRYADRVSGRCQTIEVPVKIERDEGQKESLHLVNSMIDSLVVQIHADPADSRRKCISYMNACSLSVEQDVTDKSFELAAMSCSVDDQKKIQKRLQGLLVYIDKHTVT